MKSALELYHPRVQKWFRSVFKTPTKAQELGWPHIEQGDHTLIIAPTGSGKTLAAFLSAIHHIMFSPLPAKNERCRVLYISPLKALAVDVERNLQRTHCRNRNDSRWRGRITSDAVGCNTNRRHAFERTIAISANACGHSDYNTRVTLSSINFLFAGEFTIGSMGHC